MSLDVETPSQFSAQNPGSPARPRKARKSLTSVSRQLAVVRRSAEPTSPHDRHLPGSRRPHRTRPRNPGVQRNAPSKEIYGRPLRRGREARAEQSGGKIPTLRAIHSSNLQLATDSARTTARAPKTSSRRHGLTGIGLTCDDTFSPRADLQLNPLAGQELRVTTLEGTPGQRSPALV
jgi:hypothetical protein